MHARDANVVEAEHLVAERGCGHRGFFGDRDIARASGHDCDWATAADLWLRLHELCNAGNLVVAKRWKSGLELLAHLGLYPCHQRVLTRAGELGDDAGDLLERLAGSEHDLGNPQTQRAVMVDMRKPQVPKRQVTQTLDRSVDTRAAAGDFFELSLQGFGVHEAPDLVPRRANRTVAKGERSATRLAEVIEADQLRVFGGSPGRIERANTLRHRESPDACEPARERHGVGRDQQLVVLAATKREPKRLLGG
jgi:hypothetical protein